MKDNLLTYIICPACKQDVTLTAFKKKGEETIEGYLYCAKCSIHYPIIKGIPRLLSPKLQSELVSGLSAFYQKYDIKSDQGGGFAENVTDEKIARGFEYEWSKHSRVLPEHKKELLHVFGELLSPEDFKGKIVLDAGCGQGRFAYFSQEFGAKEVIAFDMGEQVLISEKNLAGKSNTHVVQASIYDPPFRPVFDIIYSIGVIHHTPDPEKSFQTLFSLLTSEGKIFVWVYGYSSIIPIIKFLRTFTLNRSLTFNRALGFVFAVLLFGINQFYNIMKKIPGLSGLAEHIPWNMYHDRGFSNVWTICFDKLNSGIAYYYKKEELQQWLDHLPDKTEGLLSERYPGKSGSSWRLLARK